MTSVGETGATASTMIAPLNLIVMPLLKKADRSAPAET